MTKIAVDIRDGSFRRVNGRMEWEPLHRLISGDHVVVPDGVTFRLRREQQSPLIIDVKSTDDPAYSIPWCWKVTEQFGGGIVRYVVVPITDDILLYPELQDVDPKTFAVSSNPTPAWWQELNETEERLQGNLEQMVIDFLNNNPGATGKPGFFSGHGAPGTIIGASVGDTYLDLDTHTIYKLGA